MATAKKKTVKSNTRASKESKEAPNHIVKPGKDLVASMAESFKKKLIAIVKKGGKELIIDLSGVEIVDSVGMGLVIATYNSLHKQGGELKVINASEDVFRLFNVMRLDQHFEVQPAS